MAGGAAGAASSVRVRGLGVAEVGRGAEERELRVAADVGPAPEVARVAIARLRRGRAGAAAANSSTAVIAAARAAVGTAAATAAGGRACSAARAADRRGLGGGAIAEAARGAIERMGAVAAVAVAAEELARIGASSIRRVAAHAAAVGDADTSAVWRRGTASPQAAMQSAAMASGPQTRDSDRASGFPNRRGDCMAFSGRDGPRTEVSRGRVSAPGHKLRSRCRAGLLAPLGP